MTGIYRGPSAWVDVRRNGAVGNGVADETAAFQASIDRANATGRGVFIPPGTYYFGPASASLVLGRGDISIAGAGMEASVLLYDEGTDLAPHALFSDPESIANSHTGRRTFTDLQFKGTWDVPVTKTGRGYPPLYFTNVDTVIIDRCKFYNIAHQAMSVRIGYRLDVTNCIFEQIAYDAVFTRDVFNGIVTHNYFKAIDDDFVAWHQGPEIITTGLPSEGVVVANNVAEDIKGIAMYGARVVSIHDNILRRWKDGAIGIAAAAVNGDPSNFSISIHHNTVHDGLIRPPFTTNAPYAINVTPEGPIGGTETSGVAPMENTLSTGAFIKPFGYRNRTHGTAANSIPASQRIRICDNEIARTLPSVAAYSVWGYGQVFSRTGYTDPVVNAAAQRPGYGIYVNLDSRNVLISGNTIEHVFNGIGGAAATRHFAMNDSIIDTNVITDFSSAGIALLGAYSMRLLVSRNQLDGDPYHENSNRGVNGKWLSGSNGPRAMSAPASYGYIFEDNVVSNVCIVVDSATPISTRGNKLYCKPIAVGFDVNNAGIGNIPAASASYVHMIMDSDPAAANFQRVTSVV